MRNSASIGPKIRPRIELAVLGALFAILFAPFMVSMIEAWNMRPDASHGWFVVPIAAWMAWKARHNLLKQPLQCYAPALVVVVLGLMAAVVSQRAALESVGRFALVLSLNGITLYLLGVARYRLIAFPALFLFLMVPLPITITGSLTFPLQIFCSAVSEGVIGILGVPVDRLGNVLRLPGATLEVAEACSGLRSLMAFVTVGVLLAWSASGVVRKVLISLLAIPFALIANVLRISVTAALVHNFGPGGAEGLSHEVVGIGSFLAGLGFYAAAAHFLGSRWTSQ